MPYIPSMFNYILVLNLSELRVNIYLIFPESVFSTLPYTERGMPMVLNGDPKGKNMLYCNGKTVVIRDIEVRSIS